MLWCPRVLMSMASVAMVWLCAGQVAASELRCDVTYAGTTRQVVARPVQDPYGQAPVDIAERFLFKPVVVGTDRAIDRINIYVYLNARSHPVLVQQAKYLPPFHWPVDGASLSLTGQQHLYAGAVERELIYSCALHKAMP